MEFIQCEKCYREATSVMQESTNDKFFVSEPKTLVLCDRCLEWFRRSWPNDFGIWYFHERKLVTA